MDFLYERFSGGDRAEEVETRAKGGKEERISMRTKDNEGGERSRVKSEAELREKKNSGRKDRAKEEKKMPMTFSDSKGDTVNASLVYLKKYTEYK